MNTAEDYSRLKTEISADNEYTDIHDTSFDCGAHSICIRSDSIKQKVINFYKVTLQNVTLFIERNVNINFKNCKLTKVNVISRRDNIVMRIVCDESILTNCYISSIYNSTFLRADSHFSTISNSSITQVKELNIGASECHSTTFK